MSTVSDSNAYANAQKRTQDAYEAERTQSRANNDRQVDKLKSENEENIERQRNEYNERLRQVREEANQDIRKLKEEMYDKNGKTYADSNRELNQQKSQLDEYKDQIERDAKRQVEQAERKSNTPRSASKENEKIEKALAAQKQSHVQEVNELRSEMNQYKSNPHDVAHEKAVARQETLQDSERERLNERDRISSSYEKRIDRMKENESERDNFYSQRLNQSEIETNQRAQSQIQTQKNEFARLERERQADAQRLENHYKEEVKNEQARNERSEGTLIRRNDEGTSQALTQKDKTYQDYLKQSTGVHNEELNQRDEQITHLRTTDDPLKVSPFVVQKIRDESEKRSYQALQKEEEIHQQNLDASRQRDFNERGEIKAGYEKRLVSGNRDQQKMHDVEKKQFMAGYADLKETREVEQQQLRSKYTDQAQRTQLKHSQDLDFQQRKLKDEMDVQRETLIGDKRNLADDFEMKQRGQDRTWAVRMNELRRDYDRKFMDEHDQNEKLMNEMKYTYDKKLQDQDRLSKKALDDRVKAFEHQISQQEVAFKEKERFLTEHYEEELDSMRRTNARLITKKS